MLHPVLATAISCAMQDVHLVSASPPAVVLGEVRAVLPDLGAALRFEALHHRILLGRRLGYQLQQLLAPASQVRRLNSTKEGLDMLLHAWRSQRPASTLKNLQTLHGKCCPFRLQSAKRLSWPHTEPDSVRQRTQAIAHFSVFSRSCRDGLLSRSSRSPPERFCGSAGPGGRCGGPPEKPGGPAMPGGPPRPGGPWKPGLMGMPIDPGIPGPGMPANTLCCIRFQPW